MIKLTCFLCPSSPCSKYPPGSMHSPGAGEGWTFSGGDGDKSRKQEDGGSQDLGQPRGCGFLPGTEELAAAVPRQDKLGSSFTKVYCLLST